MFDQPIYTILLAPLNSDFLDIFKTVYVMRVVFWLHPYRYFFITYLHVQMSSCSQFPTFGSTVTDDNRQNIPQKKITNRDKISILLLDL